MIDLRPVSYVIGLVVAALGAFMLLPMGLDIASGDQNWIAFCYSAFFCILMGGSAALASANGARVGQMTLKQVFVLTTGLWVALPVFGSLPLMFGSASLSLTDALFEGVSGVTTTGTTVIQRIESLSLGTNLWRAILQWLGGLGIVVVAMLFLPVMKVGGMQFFRSEGFDTLGKVMPRALDISAALLQVYIWLTVACGVAYFISGMDGYNAVVHALSTVSTGGFSTSDKSFGAFQGVIEYIAVIFMLLGSMPFVRYIQLAQGSLRPLFSDSQIIAYIRWNLYAVIAIIIYEILRGIPSGQSGEALFRETLFNVVSIFSGTGYSSVDLGAWGSFPFVVLLVVGLIGGCTASTGCSIKVFRYLILFEAIRVQIRLLRNPSVVASLRYEGRSVGQDVLDSVIVFLSLFLLSFGVLAVVIGMSGVSFQTSISAAWTALCNIGPVFGPEVSATGSVGDFPALTKWLMIIGMLVGRLELMSVYVLFLSRFWRD